MLVCIGGDADLAYAAAAGLPSGPRIAVDAWGRTADPRIFAGGDASSLGAGTVVGAINAGKRAALAIADRGVVLVEGRLAHEGPAAALADDPVIAELYLGTHAKPQVPA